RRGIAFVVLAVAVVVEGVAGRVAGRGRARRAGAAQHHTVHAHGRGRTRARTDSAVAGRADEALVERAVAVVVLAVAGRVGGGASAGPDGDQLGVVGAGVDRAVAPDADRAADRVAFDIREQ